jgi:hypothetical protein
VKRGESLANLQAFERITGSAGPPPADGPRLLGDG